LLQAAPRREITLRLSSSGVESIVRHFAPSGSRVRTQDARRSIGPKPTPRNDRREADPEAEVQAAGGPAVSADRVMVVRPVAAGPAETPAPERDLGQVARARAPERRVRGPLCPVLPWTSDAHGSCAANGREARTPRGGVPTSPLGRPGPPAGYGGLAAGSPRREMTLCLSSFDLESVSGSNDETRGSVSEIPALRRSNP
jgi:hypothetical protein